LNILSNKNKEYFYLQDEIIKNLCEYFSCSLFSAILLHGNYYSGQNDTNNHLYTDSIRKFWWADFISLFVIDIFYFSINQKS
jgi:hypothetical protein